MSDFSELSVWLQRIDEQLGDDGKRRLMRQIATKLKQKMAQRIRAQRDPNGAGFIPRKRNHKRAIRRGALFQRLPRMIKTAYSSSHAEVGFAGRTATVMRVHQEGGRAAPAPGQTPVSYPVRQTVGFSSEDEQMIIEEIRNFLMQN